MIIKCQCFLHDQNKMKLMVCYSMSCLFNKFCFLNDYCKVSLYFDGHTMIMQHTVQISNISLNDN